MSNRRPIVVDSRAEADLDTAAAWYAEQRLELALELLNAVDAAFEFISQFPEAGREVMSGIRRAFTKKFPFCIYYTLDANCVTVFAILHLRRNPDAGLQRLE